jgi:hypothetical protein
MIGLYAESMTSDRRKVLGNGLDKTGTTCPAQIFSIWPHATGVDPAIRTQNQAQIDRQLALIAASHRLIARTLLMQSAQ